MRKPFFGVSDQVQHKLGFTAAEEDMLSTSPQRCPRFDFVVFFAHQHIIGHFEHGQLNEPCEKTSLRGF